MAKTDDRASQYVFVEDEDIFEEDERRLAARKLNTTLVKEPTKRAESVPSKRVPAKFHYDAIKLQRDAAKLRRAKKLLNAVPPPPSTTNPQFTFSDILVSLHNHNSLDGVKNNWKTDLSEEHLGHDVYLNTNKYVEELEHIRLNLQDRFVSNETSSHFSSIPSLLTDTEKQLQKRNGWLQSPGSRVNYLSQRKIIFSTFSNNVRTFTVDNSKRLTFLKSNSESKITTKSQVPKRALFQSPEKQYSGNVPPSNHSSSSSGYSNMPPSNYSVPSAASTASSSSSSSLVTPSRSMLRKWVIREEEKQVSSTPRSRDSSIKRSCSKSLKFEEHPSSDKKEKAIKKPKKLSQLHCKKMLWAVETLLKSEGVVSSDPEYKKLYSSIYRETTQTWLKNYEYEPRGSVSGTSDLMVSVAKKILPSVEQKLGLSCRAIKARKELSKTHFDTSNSFRNDSLLSSTINENSSLNLSLNGSTSAGRHEVNSAQEESVFSPEVLGVSNLCDDIDAVISSLDNLPPPDPGDSKFLIQNAVQVSTHCSSIDKNKSNCIAGISSLALPSHPVIESDILSTERIVSEFNNSTESVLLVTSHCTSKDIALVESKPPTELSVSGSAISSTDHVPVEPCSIHKEPLLIPLSSPCHQIDNICDVSTNKNEQNCEESLSKDELVGQTIPASSNVQNITVDFKSEVSSEACKSLEPSNDVEDSVMKANIPVCIVKLEHCESLTESHEALKTPEQTYSSKLRIRCNNVSTDEIENLEVNGYNSDGTEARQIERQYICESIPTEVSGKSKAGNSDLRKSKRKRSTDLSSIESTPVSINSKKKLSKRICYKESSESPKPTRELLDNHEKMNSLRRSGRNRLSTDVNKKSPLVDEGSHTSDKYHKKSVSFDKEHLKNSKRKSLDDIYHQEQASSSKTSTPILEGDIKTLLPCPDGSDICDKDKEINQPDDLPVSLDHQLGESSLNVMNREESENAIDKENDSSMENISDVDTQNWSPILKLKRSSKNLWSSELKKKRITSRCRKENVENSPLSSPFLDLKGPFKYRFCKRALPGEFISAIIKGEAYSKSVQKLVKKKSITKDCVLVRTVKEGLELRIPLELFKKEITTLGPNKFHSMVCDVIEDAVCKLEGFNSDGAFSGFTTHDVNQAVITSWKMDQVLKVIETTGEMVKPLFAVYKYAIVKQSPHNVQDFYQIFVEILKTSLFLKKSSVEMDTIQVRPMKSESPKKIQLEINIPIRLVANNFKLKESILRDLNPVHNIISC